MTAGRTVNNVSSTTICIGALNDADPLDCISDTPQSLLWAAKYPVPVKTRRSLKIFASLFWSIGKGVAEHGDAGWVHAQHEVTLPDPNAMHGVLSGQHQSSAQLEKVPRSRRLRTSKLDRAFFSQRPERRAQQPED